MWNTKQNHKDETLYLSFVERRKKKAGLGPDGAGIANCSLNPVQISVVPMFSSGAAIVTARANVRGGKANHQNQLS